MSIIDEMAKNVVKHGFWGNLVRTNTGVSSLNFFLICTTLCGIGLLIVVPFSIIWEVVHNDAVASDLTGWAAFIGAVSTLFGTAGIAKSWSNWSEQKFKNAAGELPPTPPVDEVVETSEEEMICS